MKSLNFEDNNQLDHTYRYDIVPSLGQSNAYGNIYFARYFEWQGVLRETWFSECVVPDMFALDGAFVTKFAVNEYEEEVLPFQKISGLLNTGLIKKGSFLLMFRFYDRKTGNLVAKGEQKIAYMRDGKLKKLPLEVLEKVRLYELGKEAICNN